MPYAPAVLDEDMNYLLKQNICLHTLVAFKVNGKIRSKIKSTIHVDHTARIQTVTKRYNINFGN